VADGVQIKVEGLEALASDLGESMRRAPVQVRQAVEVTANKVKKSAQARAAEIGPHLRLIPQSIDYDIVYANAFVVQAEVGFNKGKPQGALGAIPEFGTPNSAPHPVLAPSLDENEADFEYGISLATGRILP
jgi:hypothetical protein